MSNLIGFRDRIILFASDDIPFVCLNLYMVKPKSKSLFLFLGIWLDSSGEEAPEENKENSQMDNDDVYNSLINSDVVDEYALREVWGVLRTC